MKSNGVAGVANRPFAMLQGTEGTQAVQPAQEFGMLLNQRTSNGMADASDLLPDPATGGAVAKQPQSVDKERMESGYREITKADSVNPEQKAQELEEPYEKLKDQVTEEVAKELGISEEELLQIMQSLGITFENLLCGDGLKTLMMEVTGSEDFSELLFSDAFQKLSETLEQLVGEFTAQAELTPEEWELVAAKLELLDSDASVQTEVTEEMKATEEVVFDEGSMQEQKPEEIVQQEGIGNVPVEEESEVASEPNAKQESPFAQEKVQASEETLQDADTTKEQTQSGQEMKQGQGTEKQNQFSDDAPKSAPVTFQQTQTTVNGAGDIVVQTVERVFVDVEDLMNQISHFTRVTVQQAESSIEMQLNPAHLGKIYLQVASKEGVITAQLAAQNEAVKQALENQVAALKENMNQQGLKVEAVEVTIASHEFEQNLESQNQQQNPQADSGREGRSSRRFLHADQLEELAGTLSEEDSLAAKMMLEQGNRMDMTA